MAPDFSANSLYLLPKLEYYREIKIIKSIFKWNNDAKNPIWKRSANVFLISIRKNATIRSNSFLLIPWHMWSLPSQVYFCQNQGSGQSYLALTHTR